MHKKKLFKLKEFMHFICGDEDPLAHYRQMAFRPLAVSCLTALSLPLLINLYHMQWVVVAVMTAIMTILATAAIRLETAPQTPRRSFLLIVPLLVLGMYVSVPANGMALLFWTYPFLLTSFLLVRVRSAFVACIVFLCCSSVIAYQNFELLDAVRYLITASLTLSFTCVILFVFGSINLNDHYLAYHDGLTGTFNRRKMDEDLQAVSSNRTSENAVIAILDIDNFKRCNDEYGHEFGDDILKRFASYLTFRMPSDCSFYRMGGEEFLLVSQNPDAHYLFSFIKSIQPEITERLSSGPYTFSFSAGVATLAGARLDKNSEPHKAWLRDADRALYSVKANGKNNVALYQCKMP